MSPNNRPAHLLIGLLVVCSLLVCLLVVGEATGGWHLQALQRMTGSNPKGGQFAQLTKYLHNLQASILPIALPVGGLGIAGGGVAYMLGHHMAQKILGGVIAGTALVLLAPQLMA